MSKPVGELGKVGQPIARMKSDTSDTQYIIRETDKGLSCECIGYQTSRRRPKSCKHIRRYFVINILNGIRYAESRDMVDVCHEAMEIERLFRKEV